MNVMGLKCADLVGAMGRRHRHRCHSLDLVSPTPERIFFVPAVTISNFPSCSGRRRAGEATRDAVSGKRASSLDRVAVMPGH